MNVQQAQRNLTTAFTSRRRRRGGGSGIENILRIESSLIFIKLDDHPKLEMTTVTLPNN